MDLTQDLLNELFEYKKGKLYWKRENKNQVRRGQCAGWLDKKYMRVMINDKAYLVHRLIYMMHHGFMPDFIDHINGNGLDNRIENLRGVSKTENNRNRRINTNNLSGVKGVHWDAPRKKWKAQLCFEGKQHYLGVFNTLEEASKVVQAARKKHHGEFARHS